MKQKLFICLSVLVGTSLLLALLLWLSRTDMPELEPRATSIEAAAERAHPTMNPSTIPDRAEIARVPKDDETEVVEAEFDPRPAAYRNALSGIIGRVVEENGTPVPDKVVTLLELVPQSLFASLPAVFESQASASQAIELQIELDRCPTDESGKFHLDGALARAFHGIAVDLDGPRAALRIVDETLQKGEVLDIGDIVLEAGVDVHGRVVDESGAPVAGARVRILQLPAIVFQTGVQHLHRNSRVAMLSTSDPMVIDLPPWAMSYLNRLPFPTTTTDENGTFMIEQAPTKLAYVVVDHPNIVSLVHGPTLPSSRGSDLDLGDLTVFDGSTLRVNVVDTARNPVSNAEVIGGRLGFIGGAAILQPASPTKETGGFEVFHQPAVGPMAFAARMNADQPWTVIGPIYEGESAEIMLPETLALQVFLREESDRVVPDADLRIRATNQFLQNLPLPLSPYRPPHESWRKVEDGHYEIAGLSKGSYEIIARAPGYAITTEKIDLSSESTDLTVVFPDGENKPVIVLDDATSRPVDWAQVSLRVGHGDTPSLDEGRTDAQGWLTLGPVPTHLTAAAQDSKKDCYLTVEHPSYASKSEHLVPGPDAQTIRLRQGGTLVGTIHHSGAPPPTVYMVIVQATQDSGVSADVTHLGVSDIDGRFTFKNLEARTYRYHLEDRVLSANIVSLVASQFADGVRLGADQIGAGAVQIREGETSEISIDVDPGPAGRVVGWGFVNGRPQSGLRVNASSNSGDSRQRRKAVTDATGRFDLGDIPVGTVELSAVGPQADGTSPTYNLWQGSVKVENGGLHEVMIEIETAEVSFLVTDKRTDKPLANLRVNVQGMGEHNRRQRANIRTDSNGRAYASLSQWGPFAVSADHPEYGRAKARFLINDDGDPSQDEIRLRLGRGVPCAGTVEVDASFGDVDLSTQSIYMTVSLGDDESGLPDGHAFLPDGKKDFSITGLAPGDYTAKVYVEGWSTPLLFTLPSQGNTELVLRFSR